MRRNICFGLEEDDGVAPEEQPRPEEVEEAAKLANAHDFITAMPEGYDMVRLCCLSLSVVLKGSIFACWLSHVNPPLDWA